MRLLDHLFAVVALAGLVATSWWGVYQSPQNAANLQFHLQQETTAALTAAGMDWAVVKMDGQRAILSGKAPSPDAVRDAALVVLGADGPGGLIFGGVTQVENAADSAPPVSPYIWQAQKMPDGSFILSGHVPSKAIRRALVNEAMSLSDGASVVDSMRLASGTPAGNWQGMARLGLNQLASLSSGDVNLNDTRLRVTGVSADPAVRAKVTAEISNVAAPFQGEPMIRGASLWSARISDAGLVLKGRVSSESERREILTLAKKHYAGNIADEMTIADQQYTGWMDGVRRGLPQFTRFDTGEMYFDPEGLGFLVMGNAGPSALAYLQADMSAISGPYAADIVADSHLPVPPPVTASLAPQEDCQTRTATVLDASPVRFDAGVAAPNRQSGDAIDMLAATLKSCDAKLHFNVIGYGDIPGSARTGIPLGEARATAIIAFLDMAGIGASRLSAIGYGRDAAEQVNDSADTVPESRSLEITVLERSE